MSGIVALLSPSPTRSLTGELCLRMLTHSPAWTAGSVEAGHLYLGACGSAGQQQSATSRETPRHLAVAVCGRFLNSVRLRAQLHLSPEAPMDEVAAQGYLRWGADVLNHLEGAYALVVHDPLNELLLAGTDPAGSIRLYAIAIGPDVLIATEAKAFMGHEQFRPAFDFRTWSEHVIVGHALDGHSLFDGVHGLRHGEHFEVAGGSLKTVQQWDIRTALTTGGQGARGRDFLDELRGKASELGREAFCDGPRLLPLTGGLDSRLLAAIVPQGADDVESITFGAGDDTDSSIASRVASAARLSYRVVNPDPLYLPNTAAQTVWVTEGRLNPANNETGFLMGRFRTRPAYVSGIFGELGRRYMKGEYWPNWDLLMSAQEPFERRFRALLTHKSLLSEKATEVVAPSHRSDLRAAASASIDEILNWSRGFCPVDRADLFLATQRMRDYVSASFMTSSLWLDGIAPFSTKGWAEAVLNGAPAYRCDETMRMRLIAALNPAVARVPWEYSRLPLQVTAPLSATLHAVSYGEFRVRKTLTRYGFSIDEQAIRSALLSRIKGRPRRTRATAVDRDEWLRHSPYSFAQEILLSERTASRGLFDEGAVSALLQQQLLGASNAVPISALLNVELWHRLFVDGDRVDLAELIAE